MAKKKTINRLRPHHHTDLIHEEVSAQTPIIPQRVEQCESGRKRVLEPRERVGQRTQLELHNMQFPAEK